MARPLDAKPPPSSTIFNHSPLRFSPKAPLPVPDIDDVGPLPRNRNSPNPAQRVHISRSEWRESLSTIIRPTPRYVSIDAVNPGPTPLAWRRAISTPRNFTEDSPSPPRHLLSALGGAESPDGIVSNFFENPHLQPRFGAITSPGWVPDAANAPLTSRPPIMIARHRPENQDCYCIYAPFPTLSTSARSTPLSDTAQPVEAAQEHADVLLGLFDGHGEAGRQIAHFSRALLTEALSCTTKGFYKALLSGVSSGSKVSLSTAIHSRRWKMFVDAFDTTEKSLRAPTSRSAYGESGTAALVALLSGRDLYVSWVGHSRCVVGRTWTRLERHTSYDAVDMSREHTTNSPMEMKRIRAEAKRIAKKRKAGQPSEFLQRKSSERQEEAALTRSLGDRSANQFGSISEPEVTYMHLIDDDSFIIMASNGLWTVMSTQEAVNIVGRKRNDGCSAEIAAGDLVREAKRRWRSKSCRAHDITAIVMWVGEQKGADTESNTSKRQGLKAHMRKIGRKLPWKKNSNYRSNVSAVGPDGSLKPFVVDRE